MRALLASRADLSLAEEGAFLFCGGCFEVHRISRTDRAPFYDLEGFWHVRDDLRSFLARHEEHPLRVLRRASDAEMHSHSRHDPMCRVLWEVTDDQDGHFIVSFGRDDVGSPRRYAIQPGRLVVVSESIEIDATLLRALIDEALFPLSAPDSKLAGLIEACRSRVRVLPWEQFDPVDEDRGDPGTHLACLPVEVVSGVSAEVGRSFCGPEVERILDLVQRELRHQIPIVRLQRRYAVR
jgi:hypothetical protein